MIDLKELLGGNFFSNQSTVVQGNLMTLLERCNKLREAYAKPMIVTSGLRSRIDHLRIYAAKGITDQCKIPMASQHLKGCACDFADADGQLKAWVKANVPLLESIGLWCEDLASTPTWLHVQTVPPKSGKRFFKP